MFFKSARFKVMLLYIAILTITLTAFSILIYGNFRSDIYGDLDDLLSSRAEGVAHALATYYQIKKIDAAERGKEFNLPAADESDEFMKVARSWVEEERKDPELMSLFVQLVDPNGNIVVASKAAPRIHALSEDDFKDILDGEDSFDDTEGDAGSGKKMRLRIYSKPVMEGDRTIYVVQVAGPISLLSIALKDLRFILFILLPIAILLAGAPGIFLVKIALNPVDKMVGALKHITAENLKLKIHIPDTKDEMSRLANTFNDMIERLDRSFSSHRAFTRDILQEIEAPVDDLRKALESSLGVARSGEEHEAVLRAILKKIEAFSRIVEELRAITALEDGRLLLTIKRIDLSELIERELGNVKTVAKDKDMDVSFYCDESIVLDADGEQLSRMLNYLLDNAIKYTNRKGRVVVTARKEGKDARITVSDTGVGMPEDEIPYIFDRFYRINRSRRTRSGFGLGLSTARAIAQAHKGSISVKSQVGQGSSFTISLPLSYPA